MKRFLTEPMLHFITLGALIFVLYDQVSPDRPARDEIVISQGQQEHLIAAFSSTWRRAPTEQEFEALLEDWLREEAAWREGRRMGLDTDDVVIRRRLRQKLELLAEDVVAMDDPSEAELRAYHDSHPESYMLEPVVSLQQVYFSKDSRGSAAAADATDALDALRSGSLDFGDEALGDPIMLRSEISEERLGNLAGEFGTRFAQALEGLETGAWQGPVPSGYGLHLVRIEQWRPGRPMSYEQASERVRRDWVNQRSREAIDQLYQRLLARYEIVREPLTGDQSAP